jgi:hypothetical protein
MSSDKLLQFRNLWTTDSAKYALVRVGGEPKDEPRLLIFNVETRMALTIEDDQVYKEVKRRMQGAGVPILDGLP